MGGVAEVRQLVHLGAGCGFVVERLEVLLLAAGEACEKGVGGVGRQDAVGEYALHAVAEERESGTGVTQPLSGVRPRLDDEPHRCRGGLDEALDGGEFAVPARCGLVEPLGGHGDAGKLGEHRTQRACRLSFGRQQSGEVTAQLLREGEQGDGLRYGRQVGHDGVDGIGVLRGRLAQCVQQRKGVGAGQFGELLRVERICSEQVEQGAEPGLEGMGAGPEGVCTVDPADGETRHVDVASVDVAGVGEQDRPRPGARGGDGGGRRRSTAARTAEPGDEDDSRFLCSPRRANS